MEKREVLIVESWRGLWRFFQKHLSNKFELSCVLTMRQARELLDQRGNFDIVVLDIRVFDGTTYGFMKELRHRRNFRGPMIAISATEGMDFREARVAGCDEVCLKITELPQLLKGLEYRSYSREENDLSVVPWFEVGP